MLNVIIFLFLAYVLFTVLSAVLPFLFIILTVIALPLLMIWAVASLIIFVLRSLVGFQARNPNRIYFRSKPLGLLMYVWEGFMALVYQMIFTVSKAINDGKHSR